jgi:GDPmannose 4,6-dehydratase
MKKVLITGVTGQDGSYMVDYLLAKTDYQIFGMVRRTAKPDYNNIKQALINPRFKLIVGDLSDSNSIDNVVKEVKPDYFINLAAQSFVGSSWTIPEQTFDVDAIGVVRCLEAIRKHVPHCRFYNAGSSEEFGDVQYAPQDLKHPLRARSPYGAAKIAARQVVKVYRESYGLYAIQGLLFNHESERRGEEFVTRKITLGVARIKKQLSEYSSVLPEPIQLGNIDAKRDWSHAQDFVEGIWLMLNQKEPKEYLFASGEAHTVREFVEKAFAAAGIKGIWWSFDVANPKTEEYLLSEDGVLATKRRVPLMVINPDFYRPAEVELLLGDSTPARTELGWTPKVSFNELVTRMVENDLKYVN